MQLFTIGHGMADESLFAARLASAGVLRVVDVRRFPASRRMPWFGAVAMATWLPQHGVAYDSAPDLGGRRTPAPDSPNVVLRHPAFRGYADYMATDTFERAFERLVARAHEEPTAVMCSETLWWRCHRRLIADAATLLAEVAVVHLVGDRQSSHRLTEGARQADGHVVYDGRSG